VPRPTGWNIAPDEKLFLRLLLGAGRRTSKVTDVYDPPHWRTGAALHYVVSGVGAELIEGKAAVRNPGSVSYEPGEVFY
jgi:hypothetical protein